MVKVEIISSNILNAAGSEPNDSALHIFVPSSRSHSKIGSELESFAKDCASSIIQARYRGYQQRSKELTNACDKIKQSESVSAIDTKSSACQTVEDDFLPRPLSLLEFRSDRRAAIYAAYEEYKNTFDTINLDGTEILNILKAMGSLGPREYDCLFKAASQKQNGNVCHAFYPIRIAASLQEFQADVINAWRDLSEDSNRSHISMPKRRTQFLLDPEESSRAKKSLQQMIEVPQQFISFITYHPDILDYTSLVQINLIFMVGITDEEAKASNQATNIVETLRLCTKTKRGTVYYPRLEIALQLVLCISQWESVLTTGRSESALSSSQIEEECSRNLRNQLNEANLLVTDLRDEVDRLQQELKKMGTELQASDDASKLPDILIEAEAKSFAPNSNASNSRKHNAAESKMSTKTKSSPKARGRIRRSLARPRSSEPKEVKFSKLSTVEIKFDGDEDSDAKKRRVKVTPRRRQTQAVTGSKGKTRATSNRTKKANSTIDSIDVDKFSQLMKKSREKRLHGRQFAWKADAKKIASPEAKVEDSNKKVGVIPRDQADLFTRRRAASPSPRACDAKFESASNVRFNAILERLSLNGV